MIGLNAAVAEAFRSLHQRTIRMPWALPGGKHIEVTIRPHDDPAYQEALKKSGVNPRSPREREEDRPQLNDRQQVLGLSLSSEQKAAVKALDQVQEEIVRIRFPWRIHPVAYSLEEVKQVRSHVAAHLVVEVVTVHGEQRTKASDAEIQEWLHNETPLPRAVPSETTTLTTESIQDMIESGRSEAVYLAGEEEGVAACAFILTEAVQTERFLERLDPLANASDSTPGESHTKRPKPVTPSASAPGSPSDSGGAMETKTRTVRAA